MDAKVPAQEFLEKLDRMVADGTMSVKSALIVAYVRGNSDAISSPIGFGASLIRDGEPSSNWAIKREFTR